MIDSTDPLEDAIASARHNVLMPTRLTADMPPRAAAAHRAITGTARLLVLRYVLANDDALRHDVAEGAGVSEKGAWVALRELTELGYVTTVVDESDGRGTQRFTADRARLEKDLAALVAWTIAP
ncbi:MAG: hypothetical protein KF727_14140 [Microbacteriaceae bacterium]|nr:hypothetical protein [Microbacteriaceae bacterium]